MGIVKPKMNEELPWSLLLEADPDKAVIESYIQQSNVYLYKEEATVQGVIVFQEIDSQHFEIMNVSVAKNEQKRGIGQQLVEKVLQEIEKLPSDHVKVVLVKTGDLSTSALKLYLKCGFEIKEVIKDYFVTAYQEPIYEKGERLKNQVILERMVESSTQK